MIVKIQLPLAGNMTEALIYDEARQHEIMLPVKQVRKLFDEHEYKIYHHAHMEGTILHIDDRCENQEFNW